MKTIKVIIRACVQMLGHLHIIMDYAIIYYYIIFLLTIVFLGVIFPAFHIIDEIFIISMELI